MEQFRQKEQRLYDIIRTSDGHDGMVVYCRKEKQMKKLPMSCNVCIDDELKKALMAEFGEDNVKVTL